MDSYVEMYIQYLQIVKKMSANTVVSYRRDLNKLITFLEEHGIDDLNRVTFTDLNSYILFLEKEGCATSTVSRTVSTIKSFFTYLFHERMVENDPAVNLKAPKIVKKVPDVLTIEEMDRLLNLPDDSDKGVRDKAMLELLYATGLKVSEIIAIRLDDINIPLRYIRFVDKDKMKERIVPFGTPAQKALNTYLNMSREQVMSEKNTEKYLFLNYAGEPMSRQGFWKIIKQYGEKAGFGDRITPHIFRHSFAAHMVENGADLKSIQEMLGHSDISTTQVYASFVHTGISSVYDKAHPRK